MSGIAKRIIHARKHRGLSQEKLAERMQVSRGACGHWENGKALPSTEHLTKLASILNVSVDWLASGQGEMELIHHIADEPAPTYSFALEDEETKEVAERFFRLSKKKRKIILDLLREL